MRQIKLTIFLMLTILSFALFAQGQSFVRSATIDPPAGFGAGFGTTVSGVDLDNDGKLEIYSVNGMWDFYNGDDIPQIVKFELNDGSWDSVWAASFPNERQNTWAALTTGDLDGDGKKEVIWGYVNSFSQNTTPPRIVVFETSGDDVHGISDGSGGFDPNTSWDMDVPESTNMRPLKWFASDVDNDGKEEVVFAERRDHFNFGVISVDDVPDAGGGTETWTMELNASTELYNTFAHSAMIDPTSIGAPGGIGDVLSGVDIDKDGLMDLYAVNDNSSDNPDELMPKLFKFELEGGAWHLRWESNLEDVIPAQNTWPELLHGDLDNDGKEEVVWLIINNLGGDTLPYRVAVYETVGDTTDVMGTDDGSGNYMPNSLWDMDVPSGTEMRPQNAEIFDLDGDGIDELLFAERKDYYLWGVASVDDIPDAGGGTETWTMEAAGSGAGGGGSVYSDMAVMNDAMYMLDWNGDIRKIHWDGSTYVDSIIQGGAPLWSFESMAAVDIDGNETEEMLAANYSTGGQVYLIQEDADTLTFTEIANTTDLGLTRLPGGNAGDIDGDGNVDYIVGARGANLIARIEYQGGAIDDPNNWTLSLLDENAGGIAGAGNHEVIQLANIDGDSSDEVLYTSAYQRGISYPSTFPLVVGHYSDTLTADAGRRWDIANANGAIQLFDGSGNLQEVTHTDSGWVITPTQPGIANGTFLSATAADLNDDGVDEIMLGNWYDAKVMVLYRMNGAWAAVEAYDFTSEGGARMNGGAVGDIDNDGFLDFVTGSRGSTPNAQIYRVEYVGGDLDDPSSYMGEVIDKELDAVTIQYEVINIANLDADDELEVLYTSDAPRGAASTDVMVPIVILDIALVQATPIADVRADANGDFVPDMIDQVVTIKGVVTTPDFNLSNNSSSIYIQDETAGINIYSPTSPTAVPEVGDLVQITGTVDQYNGLAEIVVDDADNNIVKLGLGSVPAPAMLTLAELLDDAEMYEGSLVKISKVTLAGGTWPDSGSNANLTMWDGMLELTMRVDKDVAVAEFGEPTWPVDVVGVLSQYDSSDPRDGGYQVFPRYYDDITQGVAVPPLSNFYFTDETATMYDGQTITVDDPSNEFTFEWHPAIDFNDDALIYRVAVSIDGGAVEWPSGVIQGDTSWSVTGTELINMTGGAVDQYNFVMTVETKGAENDIVPSVDTLDFTVDLVVGVDDADLIPKEFFVDQNYPNPFNPTTTIRFGLPKEEQVDLRIYDILGREVVTLVNNEVMNAGIHTFKFNASRLASGTYIYRVTAGDNVQIKKMLLLK